MVVFDGIAFALQRIGGISVIFREITSRLPKESYEVIGFRDAAPASLAGANYRHRPPRAFERYRRARFGTEGDVFHSTYYRLPADRRARVVTTVYDFIYERFSPFAERIVHATQKRAAIAGTDRILCISHSTRNDLLEFLGHKYADRAVVVHLAASTAFRRIADSPVLQQVLFVGHRHGLKNFGAVVNALAPLKDLSLVCVGGRELSADERATLDRALPGRYRHAGYLSDDALNVEYNRSLCLAYPSRFEGFGIPVLESMQAGCPVIAVNASSIPEVAGAAAILTERGDADEVRAAIESLRVTSTRAMVVQRGLDRAKGFSWDETTRQVVAVYETLLGRKIA